MKNYLFFFVLLLFFGACGKGPTEPIIPVSSIRITSISIEEVTGTTGLAKATVTTNKVSAVVTFQYGINSYEKTVNANPNPVSGDDITVSAKITDLMPNTTHKIRVKVGDVYFNEVTFTTTDLKIGDPYKGGLVAFISSEKILYIKIIKERGTFQEQLEKVLVMGGRFPTIEEQKLFYQYKLILGLDGFTYWSSETIVIQGEECGTGLTFNNPNSPEKNGIIIGFGPKSFKYEAISVFEEKRSSNV